MLSRATRRRIKIVELRLQGKGFEVLNLCGDAYQLPPSQGSAAVVDGCYAASLGNCGGKISREHFISESVLEQFDFLDPEGVPWLKGKANTVSAANLNSKCLCEYHNNFLSPLDTLAGKAFANFVEFLNPKAPKVLIWGPSLERWLLKVMLGLVGTKQIEVSGQKITTSNLPTEWVEILFGLRDFDAETGLYCTPLLGSRIQLKKKFSAQTLILDDQLQGVRVNLAGMEFVLSMVPREKAFNPNAPGFDTILYRPKGFNLDRENPRIQYFWE